MDDGVQRENPVDWTIGRRRFVLAADVPCFVESRSSLNKQKCKWAVPCGDLEARSCREGDAGARLFLDGEWYQAQRVPRKRPDKAKAAAERKDTIERVVEAGLSSRLRERALMPIIRRRVICVSRATHRASLIFACIVRRALENDLPLPLVDQTFFYNLLTTADFHMQEVELDDNATDSEDDEYDSDSDDDMNSEDDDENRVAAEAGPSRHHAGDAFPAATHVPETVRKPKGAACPFAVEALQGVQQAFGRFSPPDRFPYDSNQYAAAAKTMLTSFRNSLVHAFHPRLVRYVREWCKQAPDERGDAWPIVEAITGWRDSGRAAPAPLPEVAQSFVAIERASLGNPARVSEAWLKTNPRAVLATYRRWLAFFESIGTRRFPLTPVFGIRSHFMKVDTNVLYGMVTEAGLFSGNLRSFRDGVEDQWGSIFCLRDAARVRDAKRQPRKRLASDKWRFTNLVETNGVAICVHFRRELTPEEVHARQLAKDEKLAARVAARAARIAAMDEKESKRAAAAADKLAKKRAKDAFAALKLSDPAEWKRQNAERRATAKARREAGDRPPGRPRPGGPAGPTAYAPPPLVNGVVACDPGCENIAYTIHIVDGKEVRRRLTRGQYFTEGKVRALNKQTRAWQMHLRAAQAQLDATPACVSQLGDFMIHLDALAEVQEAIWNEKTKPRWARGRFGTYMAKPKALDAFLKRLEAQGPVTLVLYGAARWSPSQRGRECTPVGAAYRRWVLRWGKRVRGVDENLTTQCCWKCGARTRPVARADNPRKIVRGLLCCDSSSCGHRYVDVGVRGSLINRDYQGTKNIYACGMGPRPSHMSRQVGGQRRFDKVLVSRARM